MALKRATWANTAALQGVEGAQSWDRNVCWNWEKHGKRLQAGQKQDMNGVMEKGRWEKNLVSESGADGWTHFAHLLIKDWKWAL